MTRRLAWVRQPRGTEADLYCATEEELRRFVAVVGARVRVRSHWAVFVLAFTDAPTEPHTVIESSEDA